MLNAQKLGEWNKILQHVVFAYNTSVHSTTHFTPFFLMFGIEARIPPEIVVGRPPFEQKPAAYALEHCKILEKSYKNVRKNLKASQKCMKDHYDLGAAKRIFGVGDKVRIRLKNLAFKPASKLKAPWSELFEVNAVDGPVISIKKPNSNEINRVHSDRLSNVTPRLRPEPKNSNEITQFEEAPLIEDDPNTKEGNLNHPGRERGLENFDFGENSPTEETDIDSDNSLISTHSSVFNRKIGKRLVKPSQKDDFVYNFSLIECRNMTNPVSKIAEINPLTQPIQSMASISSTPGMGVPPSESSVGEGPQQKKIRIEIVEGEVPETIRLAHRPQMIVNIQHLGLAFIHKATGTFYAYEENLGYFVSYAYAERYKGYNAVEPDKFQPAGTEVDNRLPQNFEELPFDLHIPKRFLIKSALGLRPGYWLGTIFPYSLGGIITQTFDKIPEELHDKYAEQFLEQF